MSPTHGVTLLRHPHPFRSMLAISNDCDSMTLGRFERLHRFLNTREETLLGPGLGLDISDSMWVFAEPAVAGAPLKRRRMALKAGLHATAEERMGPVLAYYVRAGWIDTLHSLGDFSASEDDGGVRPQREHVEAAVAAFERHGISLPVWVNHGNANNIQNISRKMQGADPESPVYALDALPALGTRFLNSSRGAGSVLSELGLFGEPPLLWTFSRYYAVDLDRVGDSGGLHRVITRRDGSRVGYVWHPSSLHLQINEAMLDGLVAEQGFAVCAQHLGYLRGLSDYPESALAAFRLLRAYQDRGDVLVARTSRLLDYFRARTCARVVTERTDDHLVIDIRIEDPVAPGTQATAEQLRGFSFRIADPPPTVMLSVGSADFDPALCFYEEQPDGSVVTGFRWYDADVADHAAGVRQATASS